MKSTAFLFQRRPALTTTACVGSSNRMPLSNDAQDEGRIKFILNTTYDRQVLSVDLVHPDEIDAHDGQECCRPRPAVSSGHARSLRLVVDNGGIDGGNAEGLQNTLEYGLKQGEGALLLDIGKVSLITSVGLRVGLVTARKFSEPGKKFGVGEHGNPAQGFRARTLTGMPFLSRNRAVVFNSGNSGEITSIFAAFWNALIALAAKMLGELPPTRLLNIKFEDVQAEPEVHVRRLIRFIDPGLKDKGWIRKASAIPRPTPSKFLTLSPDDQSAVLAACRPGLERLGYSV